MYGYGLLFIVLWACFDLISRLKKYQQQRLWQLTYQSRHALQEQKWDAVQLGRVCVAGNFLITVLKDRKYKLAAGKAARPAESLPDLAMKPPVARQC